MGDAYETVEEKIPPACSPLRRIRETNDGNITVVIPVLIIIHVCVHNSRRERVRAMAKRQQAAAKLETDKQMTLRHCGLFAHCADYTPYWKENIQKPCI